MNTSTKTKIFIFGLLILHLSIFLLHFNIFDKSITTSYEIFNDFSSSWRLQVDRLLIGQTIYKDFEYPYPPLGLILISLIFGTVGPDIFFQSLAIFLLFSGIVFTVYLISTIVIKDEFIRYLSVLVFYLLLFLLGQEVFLGGNPLPLWLGFFFFLISKYFLLKTNFEYALLFSLLAASCKHEFWIGAALLTILSLYYAKRKIICLCIVASIVTLNFYFGFNEIEIITGIGRTEWARGQFQLKAAFISSLLLVTSYIFKSYPYLLPIPTIAFCHLVSAYNILGLSFIHVPFFLFSFVVFYKTLISNKYFALALIILLGLQLRRGFEWPDPVFISLVPIFLGSIYGFSKIEYEKKFAKSSLLQLMTVALFFSYVNTKNLLNNKDLELHETAIGSIIAPGSAKDFNELKSLIKNKTIVCLPFCSGMALSTGSVPLWPLQAFYRRDRVKSFDYYEIDISKQVPDFFIIEEDLITWASYPDRQNGLFKWSLESKTINYRVQYPEIFQILKTDYTYKKSIGNFLVYENNRGY